jgi:iron(II)-dependent oxidoreductase
MSSDDQLRDFIAADLTRARDRTRALTDAVDDADLIRQHSRLMSPLVWDLAHVGNVEELWLLRHVGGGEPMLPGTVDQLYNAFEHPRAERPKLPLLDPARSRGYVADVRGRVFDLLERLPLHGRPLVERGFVFGMIAQHEQQHDETMLATHQLRTGEPALSAPPPPPADPDTASLPAEVLIPGGRFTLGTSTEPWALDNERPAHEVDVPPFWLDTAPVTNGAYQRFIGRRVTTRVVDGGRVATPAAGGTAGAAVLVEGGRRMGAPTVRQGGAGAVRGARRPRLLVRGRCLRPLGRSEAADRGRVGEGGPL